MVSPLTFNFNNTEFNYLQVKPLYFSSFIIHYYWWWILHYRCITGGSFTITGGPFTIAVSLVDHSLSLVDHSPEVVACAAILPSVIPVCLALNVRAPL